MRTEVLSSVRFLFQWLWHLQAAPVRSYTRASPDSASGLASGEETLELLQPPTPASSEPAPPTDDPQLDASYRTLDRVLGAVTMADNKALIALTFQGAIIAGLALIAIPLKTAMGQHTTNAWDYLTAILIVGFLAALCLSCLRLFRTISPRLVHRHPHDHPSTLFYFGGIASLDPETFAARIRTLSTDDIHAGVAAVTHANAAIALKKFADLRMALLGLGVQIVLYVVIILMSLVR